MSYGICVRTSKVDSKFLDFVVADKTSKHVRRVKTSEIDAQKRAVSKTEREAMESSLRVAMLSLDYRARNGFPIHRDWQRAANMVRGCARIGG